MCRFHIFSNFSISKLHLHSLILIQTPPIHCQHSSIVSALAAKREKGMSSEDVRAGLVAIANERSNDAIVTRFVRFAVALAVVPLASYFFCVTLIRVVGATLPRGLTAPIIGGIAAVLSANIITATFALLAVKEQPVRTREVLETDGDHSKDE